MNAILLLLAQAGLSVAASALVIWTMANPLKGVIQQLCPSPASTDFWVQYTRVMLTLAPLALVLLVNLWVPEQNAFKALRYALLVIVLGLLWGTYLVGRRLMLAVQQQEAP